jgi:hypothetical protein
LAVVPAFTACAVAFDTVNGVGAAIRLAANAVARIIFIITFTPLVIGSLFFGGKLIAHGLNQSSRARALVAVFRGRA